MPNITKFCYTSTYNEGCSYAASRAAVASSSVLIGRGAHPEEHEVMSNCARWSARAYSKLYQKAVAMHIHWELMKLKHVKVNLYKQKQSSENSMVGVPMHRWKVPLPQATNLVSQMLQNISMEILDFHLHQMRNFSPVYFGCLLNDIVVMDWTTQPTEAIQLWMRHYFLSFRSGMQTGPPCLRPPN